MDDHDEATAAVPGAIESIEPGSVPLEDPDEEAAAQRRARGAKHADIGLELGVHPKWMQRRERRADFNARVNFLRRQLLSEALGQLHDLVPYAVDVMREELDAERSIDRLRAVTVVIGSFLRLRDHLSTDRALAVLSSEMLEVKAELKAIRASGDDGDRHDGE